VDKVQLFSQLNVISKKKLFRVNFCRREEYGEVDELVKKLKIADWLTDSGFIRFKHSFIYHIDAQYSIECNTIYESQREQDYALIENAVQKNGDIARIVKQKLIDQKDHTKDELELKISPKGIEHLRKASL
jgi:hypothetical protein